MADDAPDTAGEKDAAWRALETHRWWPYRACAPSTHRPGHSRTDPTVPLTVWQTPDRETQPDRAAREHLATDLCHRCPLREQCLAYALGDHHGPYERWDIWGGMTAHQRNQLLKTRTRHTLVAADTSTTLDLEVLRALAAHRSPTATAAAAGLTVTRTNWHRSRLVTQLRLDPHAATRMQLLYAARRTGLLDPRTPILTDRQNLAAIPSRQAAVTRSRGEQLPLPGMTTLTNPQGAPHEPRLHLVPVDADATEPGPAVGTLVAAA